MAKFYGVVGYATNVENPAGSGVWIPAITTRYYRGDVIRNTRRLENGDHLNDDININNTISVVGDAYAYDNIFAIRFISWMGTNWKVTNVEVQKPRLIFTIGGVWNGPTS